MKKIPNPTPNFDIFKADLKVRLVMMKAPEISNEMMKTEWQSRLNATFYSDANYQCILRDSVKDMPHRHNPIFFDLIKDTLIWLAISRFDGMPISWVDKQDIKNAVVGNDHEAVELYPHQNRAIPWGEEDHLWVLKTPDTFHPYGFGSFEEVEDNA